MKSRVSQKIFGAALITSLMAVPALAENASQLVSINGLASGPAERALQSRGFQYIDSNTNSMGYTYSYWWDGSDKHCVQVEAYRGMVETISDASDKDCHHSGGGSAAAAVGVVAGAAILGALLSHKSHHHEDNKHSDSAKAEAQYDRGFTDGLHNAAYHNYDRSNAYSSGYSAGIEQRDANLSHHHGRGGYSAVAQYQDLQGARAAGADSTLTTRGFANVDGFKTGTTAYTIWNKPDTRQCVQMTVADGRVYDIRDIGQHPKCR